MAAWRWLLCLVCLLATAAAGAVAAAVPAPRPLDLGDLGTPAFTVYGARDGVPDEVVAAVETDATGFVWLGSASTVARFDGHHWERLAPAGARSLVRDLHRDRAGTLWASFDADGIARHDGRDWQFEAPEAGVAGLHVHRFAELLDSDGQLRLWIATAEAGLLRRVDQRWLPDPGNAGLPPGGIVALAQTRQADGVLRTWAGTFNAGLWYRDGAAAWQRYAAAGFDAAQISDLLVVERHGVQELWIATFGRGLWRWRAGALRSWQASRGELPTDMVYCAVAMPLETGEYALWLCSRSGLLRLRSDSGAVQAYDRRHGLPSDAVRGLHLRRNHDGANLLWVATESGIARAVVDASPWQTVSLMGARSNGVFAVLLESDGQGGERLWVGATGDGLGLLQQGRWRYFGVAAGLPVPDVRSIQRVADGSGAARLYVGLGDGSLLRLASERPLRFEPLPTPWLKQPGEGVMHVLGRVEGGQHELWIATRRSGVQRWRNGRWTAYMAAGAAAPWLVVRFVEQLDAQGRSWLWASTNQGLARFDGQDWTLLGSAAGLPGTDLIGLNLLAEPDGRPLLWLGSSRQGVIRVDVGDPLQPRVLPADELPPPPDRTVYSVQRDARGRLYACTNNGVQQLLPRADGGWTQRVFQRRDGLAHDECNTNAQLVDAHDRYWLGTMGGLSVYDPELPARAAAVPPALLVPTAIQVDGQRSHGRIARMPPQARTLRIGFALLSGQREDESRYRTQLLGYDPLPGPWNAENFRSFGRLPPGRYQLQVEARDYAGRVAAPLLVPVEALPAWWQLGWLQVLAALVALGLLHAGVQWRLRTLRAQRQRLRAEVEARTAELHAANQRLTELSYLDPLTGLANRRRLMEALESAWQQAARERRPLALVVVVVDHFKDWNDPHGHRGGDSALCAVAQAMRAAIGNAGLVARHGGEEFACLLPDTSLEQARRLAEQVRAAVAALPPAVLGSSHHSLTLSAGVACRVPDGSDRPADLLRAADDALYRAKDGGRNRVHWADMRLA